MRLGEIFPFGLSGRFVKFLGLLLVAAALAVAVDIGGSWKLPSPAAVQVPPPEWDTDPPVWTD